MKVIELLKRVVDDPGTRHQFLFQCATAAKCKKATKDTPAHTLVTFATPHFQPRDLVLPSQGDYVGLVLWIPKEAYESVQKATSEIHQCGPMCPKEGWFAGYYHSGYGPDNPGY